MARFTSARPQTPSYQPSRGRFLCGTARTRHVMRAQVLPHSYTKTCREPAQWVTWQAVRHTQLRTTKAAAYHLARSPPHQHTCGERGSLLFYQTTLWGGAWCPSAHGHAPDPGFQFGFQFNSRLRLSSCAAPPDPPRHACAWFSPFSIHKQAGTLRSGVTWQAVRHSYL